MRDLFRAANLSPGAVYRYFPGKWDLVAAVAEETPGAAEAALDAAGEAPLERGALARMLAAAAAADARLDRDLQAAAAHSAAVAAALRRRRRRTRRRLTAKLEQAGLPAQLCEGRARLLLTLCDGLALAGLLEPEADPGPAIGLVATALRE